MYRRGIQGKSLNPSLGNRPSAALPLARRRFLGLTGSALGLGAVSAAGVPLLAGCGTSGAAATSSQAGGTLSMGLPVNPATMDPALITLYAEYQAASPIFDTLLWHIPAAGSSTYLPGLATKYEVNSDASVYTFTLRQDVTFHDGTPFNAAAVKFNFDRIVDPATKATTSRSVLGPYKETRVVGPYTAQVVFSQPNAAFLNNVSSIVLAIASPTAVQKYGSTFGLHPVGTGPFTFSSLIPNDVLTLKKNPKYRWGPANFNLAGPAKVDELQFKVIAEQATQASALQTGELTLAQALSTTQVLSLTAGGTYQRLLPPSTGLPEGFAINTAKPPTDDLRVRQALQYATNSTQIVKQLYNGLYQEANSVLSPGMVGYTGKEFYTFNLSKAKSLLDAAGWVEQGSSRTKNGQDLAIELLVEEGYGFDSMAELVATQWGAAGIKVNINPQSSPGVWTSILKGELNAVPDYDYAADPYFLYESFGSTGIPLGVNYSQYSNKTLDQIITEANSKVELSQRAALYEQAQEIIMGNAAYIPIFNLVTTFVAPKSLSGLAYTSLGIPIFTAATL